MGDQRPADQRQARPGPGATFSKTGYDLQTPEDAIHNAAAYASFAAHVAHGKDGRRTE
ncbi:hypothetical protein SAMN02990966_00227 [Rhodospirillales bacterium URHD0017]|nr:hypothetical protein SAMN02990966_00227 [Rhodospirillales bacterium URHD0017]